MLKGKCPNEYAHSPPPRCNIFISKTNYMAIIHMVKGWEAYSIYMIRIFANPCGNMCAYRTINCNLTSNIVAQTMVLQTGFCLLGTMPWQDVPVPVVQADLSLWILWGHRYWWLEKREISNSLSEYGDKNIYLWSKETRVTSFDYLFTLEKYIELWAPQILKMRAKSVLCFINF